MLTSRRLNVGVVGAGFANSIDGRENWGVRTHLPALKSLAGLFNVVAICTSRLESARRSADHFGAPHAFADYRELMDLPGLDLIIIVVRPRLHHPVAMAALAAGKHVYCEWPLALNADEAREMAALARSKGVRTATGTQGHFWPAAERMRELIDDGFIGIPLLFGASTFVSNYIAPRPAHRQWLFQSEEGGNAAYRAGHLLERVTSTLGPVRRLSADFSTLVHERPTLGSPGVLAGDQVDNMSFQLELASGVRGTMQLSYTAWFGTGARFEIYGSEGMLMLARQRPGSTESHAPGDPGYLEGGDLFGARTTAHDAQSAKQAPESLLQDVEPISLSLSEDDLRCGLSPSGSAFAVRRALAAFGHAILDDAPFAPDFDAGTRLHAVLEVGERAVAEQRWVPVDTPAA